MIIMIVITSDYRRAVRKFGRSTPRSNRIEHPMLHSLDCDGAGAPGTGTRGSVASACACACASASAPSADADHDGDCYGHRGRDGDGHRDCDDAVGGGGCLGVYDGDDGGVRREE